MSVNIYNKETGELIKIAGNANGVIDDANVSNKTTYSSEKIEVIRNSDLLKETLPNDCVAFWDFAGNKPLVDKLYGHELKVKSGTISYVNKAPFNGGIVLDGTQYLQIDADKVGNLDLSQFGEEVTVLAWVNGKHKENGFIAGMWQEDDNNPKRQYGMFTNLPTYGGYRRVCGHISNTGGASPNIPYSRDYSASGRYVPYNKMCMIGFTYDGNEIKSYIDGTTDTYKEFKEPDAPDGEGLVLSKNPYVFKDGLNKTTKSNFTVGAVKLTNGMGNFYKGEILGIMIFKRALSKEEICDINYRYCNDKVILNYYNEKDETGTSFCWNYGTNIYNTAENKVYKNTNLYDEISTEYAINSGFAFTKLGDCYCFYISPSNDHQPSVSKHADLSIAMIEGCFPRISQLDRFTFKQNNKGISNYGCRIAIKVDGSIFVSEERFTSAGGNTSGSDWSTAEDKEYVFNVHNKWFKVENGVINKSETFEVPNNRLEGIGFACDEIPNTFDSSNILRVGYANLYRK